MARLDKETAALLLAALERHAQECDECSGPNDGCEFGAGIEHLMLRAYVDAYQLTSPERSGALFDARRRVLDGENVL